MALLACGFLQSEPPPWSRLVSIDHHAADPCGYIRLTYLVWR